MTRSLAIGGVKRTSKPGVWSQVRSVRSTPYEAGRLYAYPETGLGSGRAGNRGSSTASSGVQAVQIDLALGSSIVTSTTSAAATGGAGASPAPQWQRAALEQPSVGVGVQRHTQSSEGNSREMSDVILFPFDALAAGMLKGMSVEDAKWLVPGASPGDRFLAASHEYPKHSAQGTPHRLSSGK